MTKEEIQTLSDRQLLDEYIGHTVLTMTTKDYSIVNLLDYEILSRIRNGYQKGYKEGERSGINHAINNLS